MLSLVTLRSDLTSALKTGDSVRLSTLRMLVAAITYVAIAKYGSAGEEKLTEGDILDVIKKQAKTHKESIEAFKSAGRTELADKETAELLVLQSYMPEEIRDDDLKKLLLPVVQSGETNFGLLMKQAMSMVAGKADGGKVATVLKDLMSQQTPNK